MHKFQLPIQTIPVGLASKLEINQLLQPEIEELVLAFQNTEKQLMSIPVGYLTARYKPPAPTAFPTQLITDGLLSLQIFQRTPLQVNTETKFIIMEEWAKCTL